ncbi:hypothetical protein FKW77_000166 [Venturia effusa]|uniref:Cell wall mannoprotein 1 n=1 Tax=Venturia effusa TaxID=50376 RepID=A0A517LJI5_9PEZI|nr:hypothetical protein FKW77_000166 [Venturia effusa]
MRASTILSFGLSLVSLTTAATADGPAIKALLATLNTHIAAIDKHLVGITESSLPTQVPIIVKQIDTLNSELVDSANQIKATKALNVIDLTSLASSIPPINKAAQGLVSTLLTKRTVIVKGNQVDTLGNSLKKMQSGVLALSTAMLTQLPTNLAAQIPKAGPTLPEGTGNLDQAKFQDTFFEVGLAIFKGVDQQVLVSGSIWPLGESKAAAPAKRGVEFKA